MVGYESAWRCHIVDAFGGLEIDSITAGMIETWMAGMPRGAARKAWGVLRAMLRKAFRWGVSSVDVTTRVRGPKKTDQKLFSRPYALPQVMVADSQRPEHADSPIGMNQR